MESIENLVAKIAGEIKAADINTGTSFTVSDYPVMEKHKNLVKTPTGKGIDDISPDTVKNGQIGREDIRISAEMLVKQAEIAESAGKAQMGENLRRAAEMTAIPDVEVIRMYDLLRPNRATKEELNDLENTLKTRYNAPLCAKLVNEAAGVYGKRNILKD